MNSPTVVRVAPARIAGEVEAPPSKSHTIRGLVAALLAEGVSVIRNPLLSRDTEACIEACTLLGATIERAPHGITVTGCGGALSPRGDAHIDVHNSGTTLRLCTAVAALSPHTVTLTGDHQTRHRPMQPLLESLTEWGARCTSQRGHPPLAVRGPLRGGATSIRCETSQYLSALLVAAPLASQESTISVSLLNEEPYVGITLEWLDRLNIKYYQRGLRYFRIPGRQRYPAFEHTVAGDYSSATFFLCAAAISRSKVRVNNLNKNDSQGDKEVIDVLRDMGYTLQIEENAVTLDATATALLRPSSAQRFDLNNIPDALPALSATACYQKSPTTFYNIAHARIKESDRIGCMKRELTKMGAQIQEHPDALTVVPPAVVRGAQLEGHHDHRIVMALAVAALGAHGESTISNAEDVEVTFPAFWKTLSRLTHQNIAPLK